MKTQLETAKQIIIEEVEKTGLKLVRLNLFGSRAREDFHKKSDWDFYVVVNEEIEYSKKLKITSQIRKRMLGFNISCDIVIHSNSLFEEMKDDIGYLTYYVLKEGLELI